VPVQRHLLTNNLSSAIALHQGEIMCSRSTLDVEIRAPSFHDGVPQKARLAASNGTWGRLCAVYKGRRVYGRSARSTKSRQPVASCRSRDTCTVRIKVGTVGIYLCKIMTNEFNSAGLNFAVCAFASNGSKYSGQVIRPADSEASALHRQR
jgi:hypothetical protein